MWPYWLMYFIPLLAAMGERTQVPNSATGLRRPLDTEWLLIWFALTLLIGFRYHVGGDWGAYYRHLEEARWLSLPELLGQSDPGYTVLNGLSANLDWDIYGVNLVSAAIFAFGLIIFCRNLSLPWLGLAAAIPYLVVVVAMGYTRQGVALGFEMMGLTALSRRLNFWFAIYIALGATFHKSAVILFPLAALAAARNRLWTLVWSASACVLAYGLLLQDYSENLYQNYVVAAYASEGARIRLAMNLLPALAFLGFRKKFEFNEIEDRLWFWMSVISLLLFAIVLVSPASTAVDRIALYLLPLQLVISANLPIVWGNKGAPPNPSAVLLVLAYYGAVLLIWLNFATHAGYWLPYRFYPLDAGP